jgi:hypothetical protein
MAWVFAELEARNHIPAIALGEELLEESKL